MLGALLLVACSGTDNVTINGEPGLGDPGQNAGATGPGSAASGDDTNGTGGPDAAEADGSVGAIDASPPSSDGGGADAVTPAAPSVQELLALTAHCTVASTSRYSPHSGQPPSVDICKLNGAYFWQSELRIDCDGQATPTCRNGPYFSNETDVTQSDGKPLDAAAVPYIVLPSQSARFSYSNANIPDGAAAIAIYQGRMAYGIFGDTGPADIIGEASYAMAAALGIDPNPATGGVGSGVTYIVFAGASAKVTPPESKQSAESLGKVLARQLVQNN